MRPVQNTLMLIFLGLLALLGVMVILALLEGTGGHDGWLCEWGYDTDGAGGTTSGCG